MLYGGSEDVNLIIYYIILAVKNEKKWENSQSKVYQFKGMRG